MELFVKQTIDKGLNLQYTGRSYIVTRKRNKGYKETTPKKANPNIRIRKGKKEREEKERKKNSHKKGKK